MATIIGKEKQTAYAISWQEVHVGGDHRHKVTKQSATIITRLARWLVAHRHLEILLSAFLISLAFGQDTGKIVIDTKLALAINPGHLLHDAIHLWQFRDTFGSIQNQSYGYLFPMGPFFLAGHLLGLPAWITQRSWLAIFLVVGLWGTILLAEEMHVGNTWTRAIAALTYTCSPFVLTTLLASGGILSTILLPWALLPLVRIKRVGTSLPKAAALSGVAVLFMGGINAITVLAVLFAPFIWILTRKDNTARLKLAGWWLLAMAMATIWYVGALLLQGVYGFDFLPYTETAHDTNFITSLGEVMRGGGQWISLQVIHGIWTPPGWYFENDSMAIVATALLAALGIWGLSRNDMPERLFMVCTLSFGILVTSIGYWGHLGSPLSAPINAILDGPLAPLRNISKFQPLINIALSFGIAHALARIYETRSLLGKKAKEVSKRLQSGLTSISLKAIGAIVLTGSLVFLMWPLLSNNLYPAGSFDSIPSYWYQASNWLASHSGRGTSLLVPGIDFGRFTWGVTNDQPMEAISKSAWAMRTIAPLSSVGNIQMMDAVNNVLANGIPAPGLASYLARNGIRYLVAENDQNPYTTAGPTPYEVAMVLAQSPGIKLVKRFGPPAVIPNGGPDSSIIYDPSNLATTFNAIEIYKVEPPSPVITTYPAKNGIELTGGPQALLALANLYGSLPNVAASLTGDTLGPKFTHTTWIAADTQQYRDEDYGQIYNGYSYILTSNEKAPGPSISNETGKHPKAPKERTVVNGISHETVAIIHGAKSITASSYGSPVARIPGYQPLAAFLDHADNAAWASSGVNLHDPWIKITFNHPIYISHITVTPLDDGPWRPLTTQVKITTQAGSRISPTKPYQIPQQIPTAAGKTSWLKLTITRYKPPVEIGSVSGPGMAHIAIPGVHVSETLKVPSDGASAASPSITPTYLFSDPLVKPFAYLSPPTQEPNLSRLFYVPHKSTFTVVAQVSPNPGKNLINLVNLANGYTYNTRKGVENKGTGTKNTGKGAGTKGVRVGNRYATSAQRGIVVQASSTYGGLPLFRPQNLIDNNPLTSWWAGAGDQHPTVTYSWHTPRTLDSLNIELDLAASIPEEILIRSGNQNRLIQVPPSGGTVHFAPIHTNHVTFSFPKIKPILTFDSLTSHLIPLPVGLANLSFPALSGLPTPAIDLQHHLSLSCGQGPPLQIGGTTYQTSLSGTVADLYSLSPMPLTICGTRNQQVTLNKGTQQVNAPYAGDGLRITTVDLLGTKFDTSPPINEPNTATALIASSVHSAAGDTEVSSTGAYRKVTIDNWQATSRTVTIAPGNEAILNLRQNYNKGWIATYNGQKLKAVRIDGWQQGWMLPASSKAITIHLSFPPENLYMFVLLAGLLIALALMLWAFWPRKKRRSKQSKHAIKQPPIQSTLDPIELSNYSTIAITSIILLMIFAIAGPLVLLGLPLLLIALYVHVKRRKLSSSWSLSFTLSRQLQHVVSYSTIIAVLAMALNGIVIAIKPGIHYTLLFGTRSAGSQVLGTLALVSLLTAVTVNSWRKAIIKWRPGYFNEYI